ncbi:cupin domain-containing protein [Pseudomonas sp. ZM23]|uniref:Cupin domain-containing protein n=1 Tax=Pseudomonas triclosanedens TaxID=2961893 RepID=A0ABY6ZT81_9PSED|nr:cupin domain-containing protein [Pseudomonas triclosanedens]MCP8466638.1 cupin domain-containing protein [Pseudomonas triclosanedens]MCP8472007.1 cupin domain-containing protein [Pseudomonas triclosanedens]MCP8474609.1 cupin domain-containing protein [Pseudomonas triclosanedens]WAI48016.1 cupin domain-containing protein [Pseudomonas triclosanedens]
MPQPILLASTASLALPCSTPVKEPIGEPVADAATHSQQSADGLLTGVWECTPGRWRRQVLAREFSHIVAGHGFFVPDDGEPIELRAGDAVLFPANCAGTWDIRQTLRKSFVIIP